MSKSFFPIMLCLLGILLAGCAMQPRPVPISQNGFFLGIFHGVIAPFSLVFGFFTDARVYAFPNTGWLYDLGFMLGLAAWGGGAATASQ